MEPREFAESILREHEARRAAADGPWSWQADPEWAGLVALAAMATRWNVTASEFEAKLARLCRMPGGAARPAAEQMLALWRERGAAADRPTVLVVEDDETIQELLRNILMQDYRVVLADRAQAALEVARRERLDAITLDLMLPDAHGVQVLSELKADPATADVPIIVLSAYTGGLRPRDRALAARVLHKPFSPLELLDAINSAIGARGSVGGGRGLRPLR
jgi:CheY-like chemotaxis protein